MIRVGTAGWTIPRRAASRFPTAGTGLQRYAACFDAAEINSTFYGSHKPETLQRWAASVPDDFRFAVKMRRTITHERRLAGCGELLEDFLGELEPLGHKLGPLLIQLPPSFAFDLATARTFLRDLRQRYEGLTVTEPRHPSWFNAEADKLLDDHRVARVAADPARVPEAAVPAGWTGLVYFRLHGSPRPYFSGYDEGTIAELARRLQGFPAAERWCIFDNTASGAAAGDALSLKDHTDALLPS